MSDRQDFERKHAVYGPLAAGQVGILAPEELAVATARQTAVKAYLGLKRPSRNQAQQLATSIGVKVSRFYQLVRAYKAAPHAETLLKLQSAGGRGQSRLGDERESTVREGLEAAYLSLPLSLVTHGAMEVQGRCFDKGLEPVSRSTVYRRASGIPAYERVLRKKGAKEAREQHGPQRGQTPPTTHPLQRVQIDHTPFPLQLVDEIHRLPIGKADLTLILDECSRVVLGFALSLEAPSAASLARALVHSVLPKDEWLEDMELGGYTWQPYGKGRGYYLDNAAHFVSDVLKTACIKNDISAPEHRPADMPNFGGMIEAMMRTAQIDVRLVPGATGSKPKEAGRRHNPQDEAVMTLREATRWFAHWVMTKYHVSPHEGLNGARPIDVWQRGIDGDDDELGIGPPEIIRDRRQFELDFLPAKWRVIRPEGIKVGRLTYMGEALFPFIYSGTKRKYLVKIDPFDARWIYFLHPDTGEYFGLHCTDREAPHATVAETEIVRKALRARGQPVNPEAIWQGVKERQAMVDESSAKTKDARRKKARSREASDYLDLKPAIPTEIVVTPPPSAANEEIDTDDVFPVLDWRP